MNGILQRIHSLIVGSLLIQTVALVAQSGGSLPTKTPARLGEIVQIQQQVQAVLSRCQKATVGVDGGGSGVIVSPDGMVLTAAHVSVEPDRRFQVTLADGREVQAKSLGLNHVSDAGLVQIVDPGPFPHVPMAKAADRRAGLWCFALGHPSGFDLDRGSVLRVGRLIGSHALVMRTDCQLIGGDSGGPLFDLAGRVIGIHSKVSVDIDDNFHVPIEAFYRHWELFLANEAIQENRDDSGGFLGVDTEFSLRGARIKRVVAGTPAAASPLRAGDIIVRVEGVRVFEPDELGWSLERHQPGTTVSIGVLRRDQPLQFNVQLGRRPRLDPN